MHSRSAVAVTFVVASFATACSRSTQQSAPSANAPAPLVTGDGIRGRVLVSNQQAASASLINLDGGVATTIPVGAGPHEAAISHDGRMGAISVYGIQPAGNQIAIIDMAKGTITKMIDLGTHRRPHGMAFLPGDHTLLATSEASSSLLVIDLASSAVEAIPTNARGSHMLAMNAAGTKLFTSNVGDGSISEIDITARKFIASYPIAPQTEGISITPDGHFVWIGSNKDGTVTVFDATTKTKVATIPDMGMPYRLAVAPNAKFVLVANPEGEQIHVVDANTHELIGDIAVPGSPEGLFITPDSRIAFITLNRTNEVAMVDIAGRKELKRFNVGTAPDGVSYTTIH